MNSVTSNGPDLYAQICHRIREAMGEFNDDNQSIESLVSALAENSREYAAHLAAQAEWPSEEDVVKAGRALCKLQADTCNTNYDDEWMLGGEDFKDMARVALESYASRHAPTKD